MLIYISNIYYITKKYSFRCYHGGYFQFDIFATDKTFDQPCIVKIFCILVCNISFCNISYDLVWFRHIYIYLVLIYICIYITTAFLHNKESYIHLGGLLDAKNVLFWHVLEAIPLKGNNLNITLFSLMRS